MDNTIKGLYEIILERQNNPIEGSYTCYLFDSGLDKILKKLGEESAETIISAKNNNNAETVEEVCDLMFHILVMLAEQGIALERVTEVLEERRLKQGNLKVFKNTDKNT